MAIRQVPRSPKSNKREPGLSTPARRASAASYPWLRPAGTRNDFRSGSELSSRAVGKSCSVRARRRRFAGACARPLRYRLRTVADSIPEEQAQRHESGFQRGAELGAEGGTLNAAIRAHNRELDARAGADLELPILVLTEQRDRALRALTTAEARAETERDRLVAEQDKFISYLMSEHEGRLAELQSELARTRLQLERLQGLSDAALGAEASPKDQVGNDETRQAAQVEYLRRSLEAATQEIDETRADASRLQEERDEAIREMDDVRLELMNEIEAARDEAFQLETRLDEAGRLLEDARDQLRDEASRFNEDLGEVRRELDERNEEVRRLRARLASHVTETQTSHPPPPDPANELERARQENQQLRQQLIVAKRQLAMRSAQASAGDNRSTAARGLQRAGLSHGLPATQPFDAKAPGRSVTPLGFGGPPTKRG